MNRGRLKVLLLVDVATFHGERITGQLGKQGVELAVASLEKGEVDYRQLKRIGPLRRLHYVLASRQVKRIIGSFEPDVVYAHYASGYGYLAAQAVGDTRLPVVVNLWGSDVLIAARKTRLHRWKTRKALERADFVLADSRYLLDAAGELCELKETAVVPWGIERDYLDLHKETYRLNRPLKIIVPRAHEAVYNNLFVLHALAPLIDNRSVEITFPELGSLASSFKDEVKEAGLNGVSFYERKERGDFLKFMAGHDLYLSAARSDSSPVSMIEAMALGLIPVCADIEGVREWLTAESGFSFRQDDANELRSVVEKVIDDDNEYTEMRQRNLQRVRREAVFEDNIAQQIEIMKKLAGRV